jgi:hypothetical protein
MDKGTPLSSKRPGNIDTLFFANRFKDLFSIFALILRFATFLAGFGAEDVRFLLRFSRGKIRPGDVFDALFFTVRTGNVILVGYTFSILLFVIISITLLNRDA